MPNVLKGVSVVSPYVLEDVQERAREILERAKREAQAISRQAFEEAQAEGGRLREAARAEASEAGRQEGLRQGLEEGRKQALDGIQKEWDLARAALQAATRQIQDSLQEITARAQEKVVGVALAAAKAVVKREISIDAHAFEGNLRAVLETCAKAKKARIVLHPEDLKVLRKGIDPLKPLIAEVEAVEWVADEAVGRGGVLAKLEAGDIDATMQTLSAQMEEAILGAGKGDA